MNVVVLIFLWSPNKRCFSVVAVMFAVLRHVERPGSL